jgi:beta-lactamase regulating signal transducer with metallopeptidase domain
MWAMELLIGFMIVLILWFVGVLACTILPILALDRFSRWRSRPEP